MALTKNDFRQIQNLIEITIEDKLERFQDEVMTKLDAILFEIKDYRMEQEVNAHRVSSLEDRVEKVEKKVFRSN